MSSHIWQVNPLRLQPNTLARARQAFATAVQAGMTFTQACTFAGYLLETMRQRAYRNILSDLGLFPLVYNSRHELEAGIRLPKAFLDRCERSGRRYATGRNGANYLTAGGMLLSACYGPACGLRPTAPAEMVWDAMQELGLPWDPPAA